MALALGRLLLPWSIDIEGHKLKLELVSIPQAVDLNRKEADIFLRFFDPGARGLQSALLGEFALYLYCSKEYLRRHGTPRNREDLDRHTFVGYIDDLLSINAVRWLDEVGNRANHELSQQ